MTDTSRHEPVLLEPVLELLAPQAGEVVLDCTVGLGGHASAIVPRIRPGGRYVGLDMDPHNLAAARQRLTPVADKHGVTVDLVHSNFAGALQVLTDLGVTCANVVLADLGFSSNQMSDASRGLSFSSDGPLDMRLDPSLGQSAADLVNTIGEGDLADALWRLGEERLSRKIAAKIVAVRRATPIKTTGELARLVREIYGRAGTRVRIDPATRTFMALRIAVNGELEALDRLLADLPAITGESSEARIGLISFHSLEDRPIKRAMSVWARQGIATVLTPKPRMADEHECNRNPRSRSAKLRACRMHTAPDTRHNGNESHDT
ncbi:MAG: 16S rRNA (cytosine(1402)-N(4))-methyltransferase [Phycisphaerae bacterium]|jgi:16S rRNA (cytosine1402-N4)-methyltransferase|nr:16S rRNA (cytosine(1402)-N(4))-methyltransferase [Phycisphaerae bacterium]